MGLIVFGDQAFRDRGLLGTGIPGYSGAQGYTPYDVPTAVGARHFFPDPDYDDETDQPKPVALGNKWDGGKPIYQQRVYSAAKKVGKKQGLKPRQIAAYDPSLSTKAMHALDPDRKWVMDGKPTRSAPGTSATGTGD